MDTAQTGAAIIVRTLARHGVTTVFAARGDHLQPLLDAFLNTPDIRTVLLRSEAAAVMAADAYARVSARPGIVAVGSGAAACAAVAGMNEAWGSSSPVLLLTAHIASDDLERQRGARGNVLDLPGLFASCTRSAETVDNPYAVSRAIHEAWVDLYRGRPRPVMRAFPVDFLRTGVEAEVAEAVVQRDRPEASDLAVERAVEALRWAQHPVVIAGAGVVQAEAGDALIRLAEMIHAPILTTIAAKGAVSDEHPLARGTLHAGPLSLDTVASADVALAVGLRFSELDTDRWALRFAPDATLIHIDLDSTAFDQNYEAHVPICADAKVALEQVLTALSNTSMRGRRPTIASLRRERRASAAALRDDRPTPVAYVDALRRATHPSAIVVCDHTPMSDWMARCFPVFEPRTFLYPAGGPTVGFALPAAVGAKVAAPDRPALAVTDLSGIMRAWSVWEVAIREGATFVPVVFTDPESHETDIGQMARGLGAGAECVDTPRRLRSAVQRAFSAEQPVVVEVRARIEPPPRLGGH